MLKNNNNESRPPLSQSINPSFLDKNPSRASVLASRASEKTYSVSHQTTTRGDEVKCNNNKMVAKQEIECENQIGPLGDDSTDFKYGPGFVSKLRYKYLTLTLRQTTVSKQRPSLIQLRRTTSLNNLLDEDGGEEEEVDTTTTTTTTANSTVKSSSNKENGNCTNGNHHRTAATNGNGNGIVVTIDRELHEPSPQVQIRTSRSIEKQLNLKRARSVEALLRDDQPILKSCESSKSPTIEDKIVSARERPLHAPPKRLVSLIDDDERPPPGITKQTMRLFESTNGRKRNAVSRPMSNEIANKIALFKGVQQQTSVESKPMIGKKPIVPPRTTSPHLMNNSEKFAKFTKEKQTLPKLDINIIKNNLETKTNGSSAWSPAENKEIYRINSSFSPVNSDTSSPNVLSPFRNSLSPQLADPPKCKQSTNVKSSYEFTNEMNASNNNSSVVNSPLINSLSNKLSNLHMDTTAPPATITATPKNNSWSNNNNNSNSKSNNLLKIIDESTPTVSDKETNGINADNSDKMSNCEDYNSSGRVISFSQKVHNTKSEREKSPTPETMRLASSNNGEIAKISAVAKESSSSIVIQKPSHAPPAPPIKSRDNEKRTSPTSSSSSSPEETNKWTSNSTTKKKSSWSSQQNDDNSATSIVFNFSDRKDVPDYIENDGLIIRRRNELPKVSGYLLRLCKKTFVLFSVTHNLLIFIGKRV